MKSKSINYSKIEKKWQKKWLEKGIYKANANKGEPFYGLVELTYSSGDLHMGHWFAWSAPDAYMRYQRMKGKNVLFPVGGFDSFGLPAENAAIKHGIHPSDWTQKNIDNMRHQFATMGPSFDWEKEVVTSNPEYYKWTQWLFIKLFEEGLAYRAKVTSNWCPKCKTVLANEHVENGCCWRHTDTPVVQKKVDQWLFRITKYADELIWPKNRKVDWPESMVEGQNNWIGRSEGIQIEFEIKGSVGKIEVFTTRVDTIYGATFIILAPEHPLAKKVTSKENASSVSKYIKQSQIKQERDRIAAIKKKSGVFTGSFAINPASKEEIPIWVADFVLMEYGTGAIMAVPGHDLRDNEFAEKHKIAIKKVIEPKGEKIPKGKIFEGFGKLINSGEFSGLSSKKAIEKITDDFKKNNIAKSTVQYHLRDWTISRQRYWGPPIPIIYCRSCWEDRVKNGEDKKLREGIDYSFVNGKEHLIHIVPETELPVELPYKVDYRPTGKAPLATSESFIKVKCPDCGKSARRETETMDTYVDSSWYFFRYPSPKYDKGIFEPKTVKKWFPIEIYFGGPEHILGHTLYARFITKVLRDLGYLDFDEFANTRKNHGVILGPDGFRMSKSRGNVVNPDEEVKKYGADAVRMFLCFLGPHDKGGPWSIEGVEGMNRFLGRVWNLVEEYKDLVVFTHEDAKDILVSQHKTIKKVSEDIEKLHFNTAIASIMEYSNLLRSRAQSATGKTKKTKIRCAEWDEALRVLVQLLAPFAPHTMEEIWVELLGEKFSVHTSKWPIFAPELLKEDMVTIPVQVNGKLRATLSIKEQESKNKDGVTKAAKADAKIEKWLLGKSIKTIIFVPGKLVNFVTK